jgi:hypothetical protein
LASRPGKSNGGERQRTRQQGLISPVSLVRSQPPPYFPRQDAKSGASSTYVRARGPLRASTGASTAPATSHVYHPSLPQSRGVPTWAVNDHSRSGRRTHISSGSDVGKSHRRVVAQTERLSPGVVSSRASPVVCFFETAGPSARVDPGRAHARTEDEVSALSMLTMSRAHL